jgi:hypothetical protein
LPLGWQPILTSKIFSCPISCLCPLGPKIQSFPQTNEAELASSLQCWQKAAFEDSFLFWYMPYVTSTPLHSLE